VFASAADLDDCAIDAAIQPTAAIFEREPLWDGRQHDLNTEKWRLPAN